MAAIDTDAKFQDAVGWLVNAGQLPVTGERQIVAAERKVYDATPNPTPPPGQLLNDITPSQAVLEAALDSFNAEQAQQAEIEEARAGLAQVRQYLLQQLVRAIPDTAAQQVTAIKGFANGNTYLTNAMTNQI